MIQAVRKRALRALILHVFDNDEPSPKLVFASGHGAVGKGCGLEPADQNIGVDQRQAYTGREDARLISPTGCVGSSR